MRLGQPFSMLGVGVVVCLHSADKNALCGKQAGWEDLPGMLAFCPQGTFHPRRIYSCEVRQSLFYSGGDLTQHYTTFFFTLGPEARKSLQFLSNWRRYFFFKKKVSCHGMGIYLGALSSLPTQSALSASNSGDPGLIQAVHKLSPSLPAPLPNSGLQSLWENKPIKCS